MTHNIWYSLFTFSHTSESQENMSFLIMQYQRPLKFKVFNQKQNRPKLNYDLKKYDSYKVHKEINEPPKWQRSRLKKFLKILS